MADKYKLDPGLGLSTPIPREHYIGGGREEKPLQQLAKQSEKQSLPKGLGRDAAKQMVYKEKARLKK